MRWKFSEDHNPPKNINNPFDSLNSRQIRVLTPTTLVDPGAEFSTLATTDDVSAPLRGEVSLLIRSMVVMKDYSLWKGDDLYQLEDATPYK